MMSSRLARFVVWLAASAAVPGLTPQAPAQQYVFTKIVDNNTVRPGSSVNFTITAATGAAFDGRWVVFRDNGPRDSQELTTIWSYDTQAVLSPFHKLVDRQTQVPGQSAGVTFQDFAVSDTTPWVRKGTVVFLGRYTSGTPLLRQGLYAVPADGSGPVTKIVDQKTTVPGAGGTFAVFNVDNVLGTFSFDGASVAFNASGSNNTTGNYSVKLDGSALAMVADSRHPAAGGADTFSMPVAGGSNVVMAGTNATTGYSALYLGAAGGNGAVTELLNSTQALPGNPNAAFQTRFDTPALGLDGTRVTFRASDAKAPSFFGLYQTDLTAPSISTIADANSTLAGLGKLTAIVGGVSVSQGNVLFTAVDTTNKGALYLWRNGTAARMAGSGDSLGGLAVQSISAPAPSGLFGAGFVLNVQFGPTGSNPAIYVAVPAAGETVLNSVSSGASYTATSVAPGEIVLLSGAGLGPATLSQFQLDSNNRIPATLAGVQVLFNGIAAPVIYASDRYTSAIVPFGVAAAATVDVTVKYNGNTSNLLTIPVTSTMPALFSADASGSGPGAIQNYPGYTLNTTSNPAAGGSPVILYASGLGALNPAPADGAIVPAAALPVLVYPAVTVTIGGQPAQCGYAGPAADAVAGLYQINCIVPAGLPPGPAAVTIASEGRQGQPNLTLAIQ